MDLTHALDVEHQSWLVKVLFFFHLPKIILSRCLTVFFFQFQKTLFAHKIVNLIILRLI